MEQNLQTGYHTIASFFEATEGNYRNAFYVSCDPHCSNKQCGDFLFIPDFDCKPILVPVSDLERFLETRIDKTDCACILTIHCFLRFYQRWFADTVTDSKCCPVPKLIECTSNGSNSQ